MARSKDKARNLVSVLYTSEHAAELYLWYNNNPLDLPDPDSRVMAFGGVALGSEELNKKSRKKFNALVKASEGAGFLIAGQECLVVGLTPRGVTSTMHGLLRLFPERPVLVSRVNDPDGTISKIFPIADRISAVRAAEGHIRDKDIPKMRVRKPKSYKSQ